METAQTRSVHLEVDGASMSGDFVVPVEPEGGVVFAAGTSGVRYATLETRLADRLNRIGVATLVMDLVEPAEARDRSVRSDVDTLSRRLGAQLDWFVDQPPTDGIDTGLCGVDTGAAAALDVLGTTPHDIEALATVNGRLDLAGPSISEIDSPVLFVLQESHSHLTACNRAAYRNCPVRPEERHFLRAVDDDALGVAARWLGLRLSTTASGPSPAPVIDEQRGT